MPNDAPDWVRVIANQLVGRAPAFTPIGDTTSPSLSPDSATGTITASAAPSDSAATIASIKAAAGSTIAQVGALGAFTRGSNTSVSPTFGQATVAGHLLVAWVSGFGNVATTAAPGWVQVGTTTGGQRGTLWAKPNCGAGESPPVFTVTNGTLPQCAQLAEFSGAATASPGDQAKDTSQINSSVTISVAAPAPDVAFGDLVLTAFAWDLQSAVTATFAISFNNGASEVRAGGSGNLALANHVVFSYAIIPAAISAQPLGVAPWAYDVVGSSAPAVGTLASVTLAATPGKRYTLALLSADAIQGGATAEVGDILSVNSGTTLFQARVAVIAGAGNYWHKELTELSLQGSAGSSLVAAFGGDSATVNQSLTVGAYLR